jgi:hypothetical protein
MDKITGEESDSYSYTPPQNGGEASAA